MKVCERVVNALEVGDRSKVKNMETNGTPGSHTAQTGPLSRALTRGAASRGTAGTANQSRPVCVSVRVCVCVRVLICEYMCV